MKRILIAYDGSTGAEAALRDLARAGLPDQAKAMVFTVADIWLPPDPEKNDPIYPDGQATARIDARRRGLEMLAAARQTSEEGAKLLRTMFPRWQVDHAAKADSPAWGILAEARRWPAELVVVGSHGRSPLQRFFLGSVSFKVAAEAACSVRIFRPNERRNDPELRLAIGVDGSLDSKTAVEEVLGREWPRSTEFHLVTVADPKARTASLFVHEAAQADDWVPAMLEEQAEKFRVRRLNVNTHIIEGDVKSALLESAERWGADCIFMGARGIDHRDRLYLGTSASAVATRAHCTVEVIRALVPSTQGTSAQEKADYAVMQPV